MIGGATGNPTTRPIRFDLKLHGARLVAAWLSGRIRVAHQRSNSTPRALHVNPATSIELDETLQFMRVLWATVHGLQKTSKRR